MEHLLDEEGERGNPRGRAEGSLIMSELRRDPVVDRWVVIADDPGLVPAVPGAETGTREDPHCPFCPGNEHLCPPEIFAVRPGGSPANGPGWNLRVIPNRSPLLVI